MADISSEISNFRSAIYGEEVRSSMISLAEKLNQEVVNNTNDVNEQVDIITNRLNTINSAIDDANTAASNADAARLLINENEQTRQSNETTRQANEAIRISNENARISAENTRISTYNTIITAESTRVSNENSRISAENSRSSQETIRANSEANRVEAERIRNNSEIDRTSAESSRLTNENQRVNNESLRQSNESIRQANELDRQNRFNNLVISSIDPASTVAPGVVIIGAGLSVTEDGTISVNGAGDLETQTHASATYATIEQFNTISSSYILKNSIQIGSGLTITANGNVKLDFANMNDVSTILPVTRGGTGLTSNPSMLTNLGSTTADDVLKASPRPGVTGTLPIANGGTGATTAAGAVENVVDGQALKPASVAATGEVSAKSGTTTHKLTEKAEDTRADNLEASIAPVESVTATANHAVGDYFMLGDVLMKATTAIATGETITTSNAMPATVQAQINALRDSVDWIECTTDVATVQYEFDQTNATLVLYIDASGGTKVRFICGPNGPVYQKRVNGTWTDIWNNGLIRRQIDVQAQLGSITIPSSGYYSIQSILPTGTQFVTVQTWSSVSNNGFFTVNQNYVCAAPNTTISGLKVNAWIRL